MRFLPAAFCLLLFVATTQAGQQTPAAAPDKPFTVEYYYKVKWGHFDEFLELFRKNHFPVLEKEKEMGRILQVHAVAPRYHATEEGRWDLRVTIVFKNAAVANQDFDPGPIVRQLYPDQETFRKEEQRRFQILEAHWDLPIRAVELKK